MNKLMKKNSIFILYSSLILLFISCQQPRTNIITNEVIVPLDNVKTCHIYYYSSFNAPSSKTVPVGYRLSKKDLPEMQFNNFKFIEWYWYKTDSEGNITKPVEGIVINNDVTLIAKWEVAGITDLPVITLSEIGTERFVEITCATPGSEIYYTIDGSNPTISSAKYDGKFVPNLPYSENDAIIKAIAVATGYQQSSISEFEYSRLKKYHKITYDIRNSNVPYTLDPKYFIHGHKLTDSDLPIFRDPTQEKYQTGWYLKVGDEVNKDYTLSAYWADTEPCAEATYNRPADKNYITLDCSDTSAQLYYTTDGTEPEYDEQLRPLGTTKIYDRENSEQINIPDKVTLTVKSSNLPKKKDTTKSFGEFSRYLDYKKPYFGVIKNNQFEARDNEGDFASNNTPLFISKGGDVTETKSNYNIYLYYSIDNPITNEYLSDPFDSVSKGKIKMVLLNEILDSTEQTDIYDTTSTDVITFEKQSTCLEYQQGCRDGVVLNMHIKNSSTVYYGLIFQRKSDEVFDAPEIFTMNINITKYKIHYDLSFFTSEEQSAIKAGNSFVDREVDPMYVLTAEDLPVINAGNFDKWNRLEGEQVDTRNFVITAKRKGKDFDIPLKNITLNGKKVMVSTTEITYDVWKAAYDLASTAGFTFTNAGAKAADGFAMPVPVVKISWYDAVVWCNFVSLWYGLDPVYVDKDGNTIKNSNIDGDIRINTVANGIRLPTEEEWIALSGAQTWSGTSSRSELNDYANYLSASALPVALKKANEYGLYDVTGNVWEYVWSSENKYTKGSMIKCYGGSYKNTPDQCKKDSYSLNDPDYIYGTIGFRVIRNQ